MWVLRFLPRLRSPERSFTGTFPGVAGVPFWNSCWLLCELYNPEDPRVLNSYLSMVLLIAMLMTYAMNLRWGDPLGALVMFPFIAQKGIQILLEEGKHEYVED